MAIPVSLSDAKAHLRVDDDQRDAELGGFIRDAAAWVERYTGHILVARDVVEQFRGFRPVALRAWPIVATATAALAYVDLDGVPIAITGTRLDSSRRPARVSPGVGVFWPFYWANQLFTVTVRAGYEAGDVVPGNLRRAMLVLISAYDADREGGEVFAAAEKTARMLCADFRARSL